MGTFRFVQFDYVFLCRDFSDGHDEFQIRLLRPLVGSGRKTPNPTRQGLGIPLNQFAAGIYSN